MENSISSYLSLVSALIEKLENRVKSMSAEKKEQEMKIKIEEAIGKPVNVILGNHDDNFDGSEKITANLNGVLEKEQDHIELFYLRVKEDYWGCSGITFRKQDVREVEVMPSGRIRIQL